MSDYIPGPDDQFDTFFTDQFVPYALNNSSSLGLDAAAVAALTSRVTAWTYAWSGFINLQAAFHGATDTKDGERELSEAMVRLLTNQIQIRPETTDAEREALGIPVRKTTRTPVPVPSTTPSIQRIDASTRGILRLFIVDATTPESRAKPFGVHGCEIREQIGGTMPTNPNSMPLLAVETRMPYRADFDPDDIGKTVYFALRWQNTRGQQGPWSQVYSAMVPA